MENKLKFWKNYGKIFLPVVLFLFIFVFSISLSVKSSPSSGEACAADGKTVCSTTSTTTKPPYSQRVVDLAKTQLGKPYVLQLPTNPSAACRNPFDPSKAPPDGCQNYDCSRYVAWAWYWGSDGKVKMQLTTEQQRGASSDQNGNPYQNVGASELLAGDIVMYTKPTGSDYGHVGIYVGEGNVIQAGGGGVKIKNYDYRPIYRMVRIIIK